GSVRFVMLAAGQKQFGRLLTQNIQPILIERRNVHVNGSQQGRDAFFVPVICVAVNHVSHNLESRDSRTSGVDSRVSDSNFVRNSRRARANLDLIASTELPDWRANSSKLCWSRY